MNILKLQRLQFCNSKKLPQRIKYRKKGKGPMLYREWTGIGWIEDDINDEAIEITGVL